MTCIVGVVGDGIVYLGADSLGSGHVKKRVLSTPKVFRVKGTTDTLIGYTSSFRMGQILMYTEDLLDEAQLADGGVEYLVTQFIPKLKAVFLAAGYGSVDGHEHCGGEFLLASRGRLFKVEHNYHVIESFNYDACGEGEDHALGSLFSTSALGVTGEIRVELALKSAGEFVVSVGGPYYALSTTDENIISL